MYTLYSYSNKSKGAKALIKGLGRPFWKDSDWIDKFSNNPPQGYTLINWGSANIPGVVIAKADKVLNHPKSVNLCGNKVKFFNSVGDKTRIPEMTEDFDVAMEWVSRGLVVMGRKARGSCGTDIVFYEEDSTAFVNSDFWVQYKKKKDEFRIHIFGGKVISEQRKALRTHDLDGKEIDPNTVNYQIRNHRNGFIFKRNDISVPEDVRTQALASVNAVGVDFGAVDVIWNKYEGRAYVLEVNTAPGLEGTTIDDYVSSFKAAA